MLLFLWMFIVFAIPTTLAFALLNAEMFGFSSLTFTYVRLGILSYGGWLFEG